MDLSICRNCGQPITWLKSRQGKNVPIDISSITASNIKATVYQKGAFSCHFETCTAQPPRTDQPTGGPPVASVPGSTGGTRESIKRDYEAQQAASRAPWETDDPADGDF